MITASDDGKADGNACGRTHRMQAPAEELFFLRRAVSTVVAPAHLPITSRPRGGRPAGGILSMMKTAPEANSSPRVSTVSRNQSAMACSLQIEARSAESL